MPEYEDEKILAFLLPLLVVAIIAFLKAKKTRSKYIIHANAFMAFASLLLMYMIIENVWKVVHGAVSLSDMKCLIVKIVEIKNKFYKHLFIITIKIHTRGPVV